MDVEAAVTSSALAGLPESDRALFRLRSKLFGPAAKRALAALYGKRADFDICLGRIFGIAADAFAARPAALRELDMARLHVPDWFQRPDMIGYSTYVDRFAGTIAGLRGKLDYLGELGVRYLHLLPLTLPREGENDGGYAVADFERLDPRLGDLDDLANLAADCRARGISLVTDLVLNHCADSHPWARAARAGDPAFRDHFLHFPDRTLPDRYEQALPEIFPEAAPGNFTWVEEMKAWVWTTFYGYQWDLNYANPAVFAEMLRIMLAFANRGVEVLRLDSVAFLWKRMGTDCRNLPEVHELLRAFRALISIAAPALALKAEAIVAPEHLTAYLGEGEHAGRQCQIGYHNTLMVLLWSALAEGRTERLTRMLRRMPAPPATTTWLTYLRCHDDIGWPVLDVEQPEALRPSPHVRFLSDFYAGKIVGGFARGAEFQTGEARAVHGTSGMLSALVGLAAARETGDGDALAKALARLRMLYGVIFAFGGIPLIYMGDEIGLGNDERYLGDPEHAGDSRWLHRPAMDWQAAARRHREGGVEHAVFSILVHLARTRAAMPVLHGDTPARALSGNNPQVLFLRRSGARGRMLLLANFSEDAQAVPSGEVEAARFAFPLHDRLGGRRFAAGEDIALAGLDLLWLEEARA